MHTSWTLAILAGLLAQSAANADPVPTVVAPASNPQPISAPATIGVPTVIMPYVIGSQPAPAPVYSAPISSTPIYSVPSSIAPVYSAPVVTPVYSAPTPVTTTPSYLSNFPTIGSTYCPNCANAQSIQYSTTRRR